MLWLYILIFIISCILLTLAGERLVSSLMRIARFLGWREFVVSFFIMSFAASLPELFIGITSALQGIPQLSFGNIIGASVIHYTLAIAICALILKGIDVESRTVRATSLFTVVASILPLLLILDGILSRADGILLILSFFFYISWLFSKQERFTRIYDGLALSYLKEFRTFLKDIGILILGTILLLLSSWGIIESATSFAEIIGVPLAFVGILIVGLGTALPETYFSIKAAQKGQSWIILGNLMGCTAITASLVLGIVAIIYPIRIFNFSPFIIGFSFLILSAIFFLFFIRTGKKITKKEAIFLLSVYIIFVLFQILFAS